MSEKKSLSYALSYIFISVLVVVAVILFAFSFSKFLDSKREEPSPTVSSSDAITFVIDAGHGGEDGGAVASDGTTEKELNLEISKALSTLFELNGNNVKMTRTEDTLLYNCYNDLNDYTGKKKVYDLKNRVRITEECENPVYIGIHMNKFAQSKYKGLQVYYSKNNEKSSYLANRVQENTKTYLQADNNRTTKKADSSIYILDNLSCPSILIECGFLSNYEELALLKTDEYKRDMSLVIFVSAVSANIDKTE